MKPSFRLLAGAAHHKPAGSFHPALPGESHSVAQVLSMLTLFPDLQAVDTGIWRKLSVGSSHVSYSTQIQADMQYRSVYVLLRLLQGIRLSLHMLPTLPVLTPCGSSLQAYHDGPALIGLRHPWDGHGHGHGDDEGHH